MLQLRGGLSHKALWERLSKGSDSGLWPIMMLVTCCPTGARLAPGVFRPGPHDNYNHDPTVPKYLVPLTLLCTLSAAAGHSWRCGSWALQWHVILHCGTVMGSEPIRQRNAHVAGKSQEQCFGSCGSIHILAGAALQLSAMDGIKRRGSFSHPDAASTVA